MKATFIVWLSAQGIYLLLMLPTLLLPPMFLYAEFFALVWGVPALIVFYLLVVGMRKLGKFYLAVLITGGFLITLLCTYGAAWHFAGFKHPLNDFIEWIWFPIAGCCAAILSVVINRTTLKEYIIGADQQELVDLESKFQSEPI